MKLYSSVCLKCSLLKIFTVPVHPYMFEHEAMPTQMMDEFRCEALMYKMNIHHEFTTPYSDEDVSSVCPYILEHTLCEEQASSAKNTTLGDLLEKALKDKNAKS